MDVDRLGDSIISELLTHSGVEERRSRFGDKETLSFGGREFFHLDEPAIADVRLGRRAIREHRSELRSDPLVELRPNASDWVWVGFRARRDAARILRWAKLAIGLYERRTEP